jgi:chromosome partitioning protein
MQTETKTAIRAADLVIIPAQPTPPDLWATQATIELVKAERVPYRVLLNRVISNSKLSRDLGAKYGEVMDTKLYNRVPFAGTMLDGKSVTETWPGSQAALEVKNLITEVNELLFPARKAKPTSSKKTKLAVGVAA